MNGTGPTFASRPTVEGKVVAYLQWKGNEDGASPTTVTGYRYTLNRLVSTRPDLPVQDLTIDDLRETRDLYPEKSRYKVTAVFKDFCQWLYDESITDTNIAGRLRYPKKHRAPITNLFTEDEKRRIVGAQTFIRDRVGVLILLRAGLRKSELTHLRVRNVDLEQRLLLVEHGKGDKSRRIPIRGNVIDALTAFTTTEIPRLGRKPEPDDLILYRSSTRNRHGLPDTVTPMASSTAHNWWYGCLQRAGVVAPGVTSGRRTHTTRHTYATDLGRATGWNMVAVQKNLGHANIGVTVDTYSQFSYRDQEQAVDLLPEIDA